MTGRLKGKKGQPTTSPPRDLSVDQDRFQETVLDLVEQIVVVYDLTKLHPVYSNPYALRFVGFAPGRPLEELSAEPFLHPDDRQAMAETIEFIRESPPKQPVSFTGRLRDQQGRWQWVRFNVSVYQRDASGTVTHVIGIGYELSKNEQDQLGLHDANKPRELVDAIPDLIFRLNRDGYFLESKTTSSQDLIAPPHDFIGKHFREVLPPHLTAHIESVWEDIFEKQELHTHDYELETPDGRRQWFEARLIPVDASEVVTIVRNTTDRRSRELALVREIDFRDALIRTASEGIAVATISPDLKHIQFLVWNDRMIEISGYTKDEINSMPWLEKLFPDPDEHYEIVKCIKAASQGRTFQCEEIVMRSRRGEMKTVLASGGPAPLQGSEHGFMTMMQDITQRRQAEAQLHDTQQFITRIADASPDFIYVFDLAQQSVVYANRRVETALGFTQEDITGPNAISFIDLLHPEDADKMPQLLARWKSAEDDSILETEYRLRAKNGEYYDFWGRDTVFQRDSSGKVKRIIGTAKDVTEWKRAVSAVRENEARLRTMLEGLENVAVWAHNDQGVITFWNRACESLYGYSVDAAMGAELDHVFRARDLSHYTTAAHEQTEERCPPTVELELERADGSAVFVYSSCVQHKLPGRPVELFYFDVDITKHRHAESELAVRQAELAHISRLTTMGQMAAELSHEIAQPLSAIGNFSSACERILASPKYDQDKQLRSYVERITDQTNRCGQILHRLRDFSRRSNFTPEPCSPGSLIRDSVAFVAGEMRGRKIHISIDVDESLPDLECDRVLLQQVFVNLLTNASDALATLDSADKTIKIRAEQVDNEIVFEILDNGPGLNELQAKQLFEPFFTTKPAGMGIGLSICQSIVEEHRGSIAAKSIEPHGASFRVSIPIKSSPTSAFAKTKGTNHN